MLTIVFLGLYSLARGKLIFVIVSLGMLFAAFALAYRLGYPPTVGQRVAMWLDPWANALPGGNQIAQGYWALSTGALWGTGGGLGDPQLVPAAHTDFVLTAIGEELGWVGLATIVGLYALLIWRCLRAALRAPGDYTAILATGVALSLIVQAIIIASGLLGLLPLSGVVTPFLSYGRSSMLANCAAIGIALAISRRAGPPRPLVIAPLRTISYLLAAAAVVLAARAAWIQVIRADHVASAASLAEQADGGLRFEYNPRLVDAARVITRGTIYDRNGAPLATSRADEKKPRRPVSGRRITMLPAGAIGVSRDRRIHPSDELGGAKHVVCRARRRRGAQGLRRSGHARPGAKPQDRRRPNRS